METISLHYRIPNEKPFDRCNWFETYIGNFVVPVLNMGKIQSYWFSRYNDTEHERHTRFRIRLNNFSEIKTKVEDLAAESNLTKIFDEEPYDGSEIRDGLRFLGDNKRQLNCDARYELIWNFLHATSRLYVDCLSDNDSEGRWSIEYNSDEGNCADHNTVETFHHFFCNITGLKPMIYETDNLELPLLISPMRYHDYWVRELKSKGQNTISINDIPKPVNNYHVQF